MHSTLQRGLEGLHLGMAEQKSFWQCMHFATDSVPESKTWIPSLLKEWKSPRKVIVASMQPGTISVFYCYYHHKRMLVGIRS